MVRQNTVCSRTVFPETGRGEKEGDYFLSVFCVLHLALNTDRRSVLGRQQSRGDENNYPHVYVSGSERSVNFPRSHSLYKWHSRDLKSQSVFEVLDRFFLNK